LKKLQKEAIPMLIHWNDREEKKSALQELMKYYAREPAGAGGHRPAEKERTFFDLDERKLSDEAVEELLEHGEPRELGRVRALLQGICS
jgi:hypothetical protein